MKRKVWEITVLDNPNRTIGGENDIFYTTDTEAFLIFRLTDKDFNPATATLTLVNTSDKSVISETVPVVDKEIEWEMTEDAIVHSGNWQAQLVYTQEKAGKPERYTAPIVQFDIQSHLMTGRQPTLIAIEDWNTFMSTAQGLLAQLEEETDGIFINIAELEQQYRDSEQARADAENVRETNESTRQAEESQRASSEQQREANESLRESSETDRVSAEQNRVTAESERNDLYDLVQQKLENGEFVGEKGDTGDGLEYVWNGTQLGVRKEGETEYVYVDLKGDKGETGAIENLDSSHIVDALGYMPISATDLPEPTWANLQNKPTEFNPTSHTHSIDDVTGLRAELDSVPELTKENVGLGNVDNVKQASKVEHDQLATDFSAHQSEVTAQLAQNTNAILNRSKHPIIEYLLERPRIMAHRALYKILPENTIPAFYTAWRMGVELFETDIRKTIDGHFVVIHDANTLRTTGVSKVVSQSTLAELRELDQSKTANASLYGNPKIPKIEELFQFIKDTGCIVNINFDYGIETDDIPIIVNKIYDYGIKNNVICQGQRWHDVDSTLCISNGSYIGTSEERFKEAQRKGNMIASYSYGYSGDVASTENIMKLATKYSVPVVIYTVEKYPNFKKLDKTGVNAMMVDYYWQREGAIK